MGETEVLTRLEAEVDLKGEGEKSNTELVREFPTCNEKKTPAASNLEGHQE